MSRIVGYGLSEATLAGYVKAYPQAAVPPGPSRFEDLVRGLFEGGTYVGGMYDPFDPTTRYRAPDDLATGAAIGEGVGLLLDKSQGMTLGPELVSNPGPFSVTTGWTVVGGNTAAASGGDLVLTRTNTGTAYAYAPITTVIGGTYEVELNAAVGTSPAFSAGIGTATGTSGTFNTGDVTSFNKKFVFKATATTHYLRVVPTTVGAAIGQTTRLTKFSVKLRAGNHVLQATPGARPVWEPTGLLLDGVDDILIGAMPPINPIYVTGGVSLKTTVTSAAGNYTSLFVGTSTVTARIVLSSRAQSAANYVAVLTRESSSFTPIAPTANTPTGSFPPGFFGTAIGQTGSGSIEVRANNGAPSTSSYVGTPVAGATTVSFGNFTNPQALQRTIRRVFFIDRVLTAPERELLNAWLMEGV